MPHEFILFSSVLANGRTVHQATLSNQPKFIIGYKTSYQGNLGLYNTLQLKDCLYKPEDFAGEFGFWAYFIYPTAKAESGGSYFCLNTYDRAKFTFSFMQYAAHVPNGDFVKFFKKLLVLPNAKDYFPKLELKNNRILYKNYDGTLNQLENDSSTQALMDYLNPSLNEIENQELICSARMVHWAMNDPSHRRVQVETAIEHFKKNMQNYALKYNLDKAPAKVCQIVCDIRHQGRGTSDRINEALNTNGNWDKAFSNLCTIGNTHYQSRINTVRNTIKSLENNGLFSCYYSIDKKDFIKI
jgi:hypothetical protein